MSTNNSSSNNSSSNNSINGSSNSNGKVNITGIIIINRSSNVNNSEISIIEIMIY